MADAYPPEPRPIDPRRPPWWLVFRAVGAASDPRCVILAALGLAALRVGWAGLAQALGPAPWLDPGAPSVGNIPFGRWVAAVLGAVAGLIGPFVALFRPGLGGLERLEAGLASLWALVVWGLFGTAIARVAAVKVATGGRVGLVSALRFGLARLGSSVAAPAAPIGVAIVFGLFGAAVGLLDRIPGPVGTGAATVLAFVPLVVGLLDAVILLGLALAWPLMIATVAVEGEDLFEAISRSYSYVNRRTVTYVGYLLLAAAVGAVGVAVVGLFVDVTLGLADWSVGLGAPRGVGFRFGDPASPERSGLPALGYAWRGIVEVLAAGWLASYLWSASAILYLLLRYDVDGAEIGDVFEPSHAAEPFVPDEPTAPDEVSPPAP